MTEQDNPSIELQAAIDTFKKRLAFLYNQIIDPESPAPSENAVEEYDMELFFGSEVPPEVAQEIKEKLGVDSEATPDLRLIDGEENEQMVGWKMVNPDWSLLKWTRDDGIQLLTYEEMMLPDFAESLGMEVKFLE